LAEQRVTLVAEPGRLAIKAGLTVPVWTFNGTVPGPEIRVRQGTHLIVTLVNHLPVATSIHWHGVIAPNPNDGVSGVTQNAVLPGKSYTYSFTANDSGTYWYHSHQHSAEQVDKGLYGALVVLPSHPSTQPAIDRTLMLDEWPVGNAPTGSPGMGGMQGMGDMGGTTPGLPAGAKPYLADPGMSTYRTFTINGRSYPGTAPIQAAPRTLVRVRLVNVGYLTHFLHLHGAAYRLVATDGSAINQPGLLMDLLPISPGQRMDIEFRMPTGSWSLHDHNGLPGADELRVIVGQSTRPAAADQQADRATPPLLDLARYGQPAKAPYSLKSRFDRVFRLVLDQAMGGMSGMSGMDMNAYSINGQLFPHTRPLVVRTGQRVEITFVNKSKAAHPMHIHGHQFQVLTLNGQPVTGSPIYQDTVTVLPGRITTVAFTANNPGLWMLHCHELHHASAGMDTMLEYQGYPHRFSLGGPSGNNPE